MKAKLLDLFCGAGGAAMGYHRAGFEVVGVDIKPQPHYPFEFHQADALTYPLEDFDCYHASPPCQAYSMAGQQWRAAGKEYPDLIKTIRLRLQKTGKQYVIENVPKSPLINPIILNGAMFGLRVHRIRFFECSFEMPFILLPQHKKPVKMGRPIQKEDDIIQPVGHLSGVDHARKVMGINWYMTQGEIAQAIPVAYTEYIGKYLMKVLEVKHG